MQQIHAPESMATAQMARRRLAFDELLRLQMVLVMPSGRSSGSPTGIRHLVDGPLVARFRDRLPFPLTGAQQRAIAEIQRRPGRPPPMHRLLQGDVGSGKTVVAVATLLTGVQGGYQGALDGSDRGAGRAAPPRHPGPARRARPSPTTATLMGDRPLARRAAHQQDHRARSGPGSTPGWPTAPSTS